MTGGDTKNMEDRIASACMHGEAGCCPEYLLLQNTIEGEVKLASLECRLMGLKTTARPMGLASP